MPAQLTNTSTPQEIQAVATLMRDCGVAVDMTYGAGASGAYVVDMYGALINHFGFSPDMGLAHSFSYSNEGWDALLRSNISNLQPIVYFSSRVFPCGDGYASSGHAYIVDGYNREGFYHFNFGWNGSGDGWYSRYAIEPTGESYTNNQEAIVGILPDSVSNILSGYGVQQYGRSRFKVSDAFHFYDALGLNASQTSYSNSYSDTITFVSDELTKQLVLDIISYKDGNISVYDGETTDILLRQLFVENPNNDFTPIISTQHAFTVVFTGSLQAKAIHFRVGKENSCRMVSEINAIVDSTNIHLSWEENGTATHWRLEYGLKGFLPGSGIIMVTDSNHITIPGISKDSEYEIRIQPDCDSLNNDVVNSIIVNDKEMAYWIDIVTTQPEGYMEDSLGNVEISSVEGLAWLSKQSQNLDYYGKYFFGRKVLLTEDIDLTGYKWRGIKNFHGTFDGQGHTISNMCCVEDSYNCALFRTMVCAVVKNVNMINVYSKSTESVGMAGGIVGEAISDTIVNCFVSGTIEGFWAGPIIAYSDRHSNMVLNCASNCNVSGYNIAGGIVGKGSQMSVGMGYTYPLVIENCYSASSTRHNSWGSGTILGYGDFATLDNCYGYEKRQMAVKILTGGGEESTLRNSTWFNQTDSGFYLIEPIFFESDSFCYSNLKEALNAGVRKYNIEGLKLWVDDTLGINDGMPIFGPEYIVTCPNIKNLAARNVMGQDGRYGVELSWTERGDASTWEVKYHITDSDEESYIITSNNPDTIWGLTEQNAYVFRVRPICDVSNKGGWSDEVSHIFDRVYWTEIVTTEPDGYVADSYGNVVISTAEGMAWFISVVNGLNGETGQSFEGKTINLSQDVNISKYKWTSIRGFGGTFNGNNHRITGLYINEMSDFQGLFGRVSGGNIINVILDSAYVRGEDYVGVLIGLAEPIHSIVNCHTSGIVFGDSEVGGMAGGINENHLVDGCSSSGIIQARYDQVGGLIGHAGLYYWDESENYHNGHVRNSYSNCTLTSGGAVSGGLIGEGAYKMENSYAAGDVHGYLFNGGVVGSIHNDESYIKNCYACGTVSKTEYMYVNNIPRGYFYGALVGTTTHTPLITYCYGKADAVRGLLIGDSEDGSVPVVSDTASLAIVEDHVVLLDSVAVGSSYYYDLLPVLNAWVDAYDTAGVYLYWQADTANINKGFPILADETDRQYVVTFINDDSTILQVDTLERYALPKYYSALPTKKGTAEWSYVFTGWSSEITAVTCNIVYKAMYRLQKNKYVITFMDDDSTIVKVDTLAYGNMPYCYPPYRESTPEYQYTFLGWTPEIVPVTCNATYIAVYDVQKLRYNVVFQFEDSMIIDISSYEYGEMPVIWSPEKQSTLEWTYVFIGWSPELSIVTGEATYTALFDSTKTAYRINSLNCGGPGIISYETGGIPWGEEVQITVTPNDDCCELQHLYVYAFIDGSGYTEQLTVTEDYKFIMPKSTVSISACFTTKMYSITYNDYDGQEICQTSLSCGSMLQSYHYRQFCGSNPVRPSTAQYTYIFAGWMPNLAEVTEDAVYTATYDSLVNTYTIMFLNEDSTLLQIDTLAYGTMPEYRGEDPVKPNEGDYFFVFTGWEPEVVPVVGNATYVATYESHGTGFDNVAEKPKPIKVMENGKLYILLPDGTKYSATGKKVE